MTVAGECRLFDLTRGGRFTLLNFGVSTATIDASAFDLKTFRVVVQAAVPNDIADSEGYLASAYHATRCTLVLIRPDGYVAVISDAGDVSSVSNYLAAIG